MPLIKVREDESLENALKRFKRKCEKSGILTEIKKRARAIAVGEAGTALWFDL